VALCLSQLETVESGDIRDFRFGLEIDGGLGGGGGEICKSQAISSISSYLLVTAGYFSICNSFQARQAKASIYYLHVICTDMYTCAEVCCLYFSSFLVTLPTAQ